jgi:hypothetical protein
LIVTGTLCLGVAAAHAGPCTKQIAQFESAVRQSANNPDAGPSAPQSVGAQIDRQPTPSSVKRADQTAQGAFNTVMARAKKLDARGDRVGCTAALSRAKQMYDLR